MEAGGRGEVRGSGGKTNRTQQSVTGRITLLINDAKILPDTREADRVVGQWGGRG